MPPLRGTHVKGRITRLEVDKAGVLSGYGLGIDGKLYHTTLKLGDHLANVNGILQRRAKGDFQSTAQNICLNYNWHLCLDLEHSYFFPILQCSSSTII